MNNNFDLDSIKNLLNSNDVKDSDASFSLDDILKDYGSDIKANENVLGNHMPQDVIVNNVNADSKDNLKIEDVIEKPDGYSLTGAFEAIRGEKNTDSNVEPLEEEFSVGEGEIILQTDDSNEIVAEIEQKRFFNTQLFNSIKDENSSNVKESIASFASGNDEEEDDGEEEFFKPVEPTEEIDDYDKQEDREDIISELKKINSNATLRSTFTFVMAIVSGLFFAMSSGWISLPWINVISEFKMIGAISFVVSLLATVVNISSLITGLKYISRLKFSTEVFLLIIFILNSILDVTNLFKSATSDALLISFDFIYILFLYFNIFSKKLIAKTIYKNFLISSADGPKSVVNKPNSEEALNDIMLETGCSADIVYASKTEFVSDFITKSFKDFYSSHSRLNLIIAFVILVLSFVNFIYKGDAFDALIYAISAFCVSYPILFAFSFAVPMYLNNKKTRRFGGVMVGSQSSIELSDVQTLIVDDADIFNSSLNGIRLYGDSLIDDAILYLNALYNKVGGPLKKLFSDMLSDDISSLPRIDEIYYHDTMGYSGLIHSKVFVAGNKKLMDHFGVEVDDSEYEILYQQKSKHVLFVAYDGKLMGVFLLSYFLSHGVKKAFEICEKNQIAVCIAERDANINERTLFDAYKPKEKVLFNIISFRTARNCFDKFEVKHKTPSLLISHTGIKGLAAALHSCKTLQFAVKTNKIITKIASILAIPLITFLLFMSEPSSNLAAQVLIYQALWSMPILFVSLFSK